MLYMFRQFSLHNFPFSARERITYTYKNQGDVIEWILYKYKPFQQQLILVPYFALIGTHSHTSEGNCELGLILLNMNTLYLCICVTSLLADPAWNSRLIFRRGLRAGYCVTVSQT